MIKVFKINVVEYRIELNMCKYFKAISISLLCTFFAQLAYAQTAPSTTLRPLVSPDLTGFHQPISLASTDALIDETRGWIYFRGVTHIKGVKVDGMFRSSLKGEIDYSWLPKNISGYRFFALAENGDLVFLSDTTPDSVSSIDPIKSTALRLLRISHISGAAVVTQTSIPNVGGEGMTQSLSSIAIADVFLYFVTSDGSDSRNSLRRFNLSTSTLDGSWTRAVDPGARILKAAANAIYVTSTVILRASPSAPPDPRAKVQRISIADNGSAWSTILAAGLKAAQVDSVGRIYLLAEGADTPPKLLNVQRLNANGDADADWSIARDGTTSIGLVARSSGWLVNNRLVVLVDSPSPLQRTLASFGGSGTLITRRLVDANELGSTLASSATRLFMVSAHSIDPLDTLTLRHEATFTGLYAGLGESPAHVMPQRDGSLIVAGNFSVWYEGEEYRNYMRLQANGLPDLSQRIDPEIANRFCGVVPQAKRDVLIYYSCEQSNGSSGIFYLFDPSRNISRVFDLKSLSTDPVIASNLAADGWLYFLSYVSDSSVYVRRANLASGAVDANWSFVPNVSKPLSDFGGYIASLDIDEKGGMWLGFAPTDCFTGQCGVFQLLRYAFSDPAAPPELVNASGFENSVNSLRLTKTHAYIGLTRYLLGKTLVKDRTWDSTTFLSFVVDHMSMRQRSKRPVLLRHAHFGSVASPCYLMARPQARRDYPLRGLIVFKAFGRIRRVM